MKNNNQYSFTVITAAYNSRKYISKCILSVIRNKYNLKKIEHIIVDDGSIDDTYKVVKKFADKFPHIKLYRKSNSNWGGVMNYVKENKLIHNDYVVICDSDDMLTKNAFYNANKYIKDADFAIGGFYFWNGKHIKFPYYSYYYPFKRLMRNYKSEKIYAVSPVPFSYYIKNQMFYASPKFKENILYQDIPLFFWAQRNAKIIANIPRIMGYYWSIRPGNSMSIESQEKDENFEVFLNNMHYLESIDEPTFAFLYLLRTRRFFETVKQRNIKFTFHSNPSVKILPWIFRWVMWIIYRTKVRKYFIIKKD